MYKRQFPGSEPEVYNLIKFITAHPNITGGMTFHTFSGVLLRPYGTESDETFPAEDLWTYKAIGKKGTELTGYPAISVFHDFKYHPKEVITGVFDDWMYEHLGVFAWTVEIWSPHRQAGLTEGFHAETKAGAFKFIEWYRDHPVEDDLKMLKWADEIFGGEGFVEWKHFDHPQLGKIEIGGWNVHLVFRNPPPNKLEAEIAPLADWAIWHALISPEICLTSATATKLGDGAYLVQMVIDNVGWLPTYVTKKALEKKAVRALVVEIELPEGARLYAWDEIPEDKRPLLKHLLEMHAEDDLGRDSLARVEFVMTLEELFHFTIPDDDAERIRSMGDLIDYLLRRLREEG